MHADTHTSVSSVSNLSKAILGGLNESGKTLGV